MGRLIYSMMVSLDGYIQSVDGSIDWITIDEEIHSFANAQTREIGVFLYGRRLYEVMSSYWPTADEEPTAPTVIAEYARLWRPMPKVVYSKTLHAVEWNSALVRDVVADEVVKLKETTALDLSVGGATLAATFARLGLIDEFHLFVNPIVLGAGTPFFPPLDTPVHLRLLEQRGFASGVTYLRYQRDDGGS